MKRPESHYTPVLEAEKLVGASSMPKVRTVADFCVGDGNLVFAAWNRWPNASLFVNDVDAEALELALKRIPHARSLSTDFLSDQFYSELCDVHTGNFDLVLMNPPFSNVGRRKWSPSRRSLGISCSRAMAFLLSATDYLHPEGEILAILPASMLKSDIDAKAREVLFSHSTFSILTPPRTGVFPGVDATTFTARLSEIRLPKACNPIEEPVVAQELSSISSSVVRGSISTSRAQRIVTSDPLGLLHTTSIKDGKIVERYEGPKDGRRGFQFKSTLSAVLVPRVGKVRAESIAVVEKCTSLHMSDCLFAVLCKEHSIAQSIRQEIVRKISILQLIFSGTGAPYTSRENFVRFLAKELPNELLGQLATYSRKAY